MIEELNRESLHVGLEINKKKTEVAPNPRGITRKGKLLCILGPTGADKPLTGPGNKMTPTTRLE